MLIWQSLIAYALMCRFEYHHMFFACCAAKVPVPARFTDDFRLAAVRALVGPFYELGTALPSHSNELERPKALQGGIHVIVCCLYRVDPLSRKLQQLESLL